MAHGNRPKRLPLPGAIGSAIFAAYLSAFVIMVITAIPGVADIDDLFWNSVETIVVFVLHVLPMSLGLGGFIEWFRHH